MPTPHSQPSLDHLFVEERPRVLATLIRILGDIDLAEDATQNAFLAARSQWERDGIPKNPRAWLVSTGRFKAIDAIRRDARNTELTPDLAHNPQPEEDHEIEDDRLRLIFICCHPSLPQDGQTALTLREVCGLTTEDISRAFLTSPTTVAQRIVRAKSKIRDENLSYELPEAAELQPRLEAVLRVAYLVFNEGYYASSGYSLTRASISDEAIRLARLLAELVPQSEVFGLLALMLFHESRRSARTTPAGDIILMPDQNRSLWNQDLIAEAVGLVERSFASSNIGVYALQAAISAEHAKSTSSETTNWGTIVSLYDRLLTLAPSPVVELNRAVAVAMIDGPAAGLMLVDELLAKGALTDYPLAHSTRAEFCRRLGNHSEAITAYQTALNLATLEPERRFLKQRIAESTEIQSSCVE